MSIWSAVKRDNTSLDRSNPFFVGVLEETDACKPESTGAFRKVLHPSNSRHSQVAATKRDVETRKAFKNNAVLKSETCGTCCNLCLQAKKKEQ
ncbi:hypothetical protein CEXT_535741 [Caerostris extrusa]|uniref:Uncharacterized protein n=1 Tax=Caerostris extrusa TaxID=172846 RepID=A0AAV4P4Z9_CAEEX|nr:hypothetical protein CEXT_535741 [Caerostris extrusa]